MGNAKFGEYIGAGLACKYLGISKLTLKTWSRKGLIKYYKNPANGFFLYLREDLDRARVMPIGEVDLKLGQAMRRATVKVQQPYDILTEMSAFDVMKELAITEGTLRYWLVKDRLKPIRSDHGIKTMIYSKKDVEEFKANYAKWGRNA
jgi:DNA-binding transcriptional MerR regulator